MSVRTLSLVTAASVLSFGAAKADDLTLKGHVLAGNGMTLVTMDNIAAPGEAVSHDLAARLDAIAFRPVTGELLGFSRDGVIYAIDPATGALTDLGAEFDDGATIGAGAVAFDVNNQIDAVRAVGADGANLVYFPSDFGDDKAGRVKRFTDTFYADGDVHAGTEPLIYANAYTNAIAGAKAGATAQYALDARTDSLVSLANNAGALTTIGRVTVEGEPVDLVSAGGFDIVSPAEGIDHAYAVLQMDGADSSALYTIDLETGAATRIGDLGMTGITGFAVSLSDM